MKHILMDCHSDECNLYQKNYAESKHNEWSPHIFCNHDYFLFYHAANFYLLEYSRCLEGYNHLDWKLNILKQAFGLIKLSDFYNVERCHSVTNDLKDLRLRGIKLKKTLNEFNATYCDASGKEYCFFSSMPFQEHLVNSDDLLANTKDAITYLKSIHLERLINDVENLLMLNHITVDNREVVKSIDELIKQINKK